MLQHNCSLIVLCSCFLEGCGKAVVEILHEFMLNRKEVNDGDHSQKTCEVGVSEVCCWQRGCTAYSHHNSYILL